MGGGSSGSSGQFTPPDKWHYLIPNSIGEGMLKEVCEHAKKM